MFIAAILASIVCGIIGTLVVVKRIVFVTGGISHSTFGGIGLAYLIQSALGLTWFDPMLGALLFTLGAALILGSDWMKKKVREDSTIGIIWVVGMALGILFINMVDPTKVRIQDPMSILFGNILLIRTFDLLLMAVLVLVIAAVSILFFHDLQILTFDEEFAQLSGINVRLLNYLLLVMIAFTTVILIKVVGVILIIAMLTIPPAISGIYISRLKSMMIGAILISIILSITGAILSIEYDLPPGASIVTVMGAAFITARAVDWFAGNLKKRRFTIHDGNT